MKYIEKDISTVDRGVIAHGVNCQGKMNSGVAKILKDKWPIIAKTYSQIPPDRGLLGMCSMIAIEHPTLYVANCYTQFNYGKRGKFASPQAIHDSLTHAFGFARLLKLPLYMPLIGAGRGGLDWQREVESVIRNLDEEFDEVDTYICEWRE